jgi:hypothetical protein
MALYVLTCDKCGRSVKKLLPTAELANKGTKCLNKAVPCDGTLRRTPTPPTVHNKEVLRFGHQVKDVERFSDAEQLYKERSDLDPRKVD